MCAAVHVALLTLLLDASLISHLMITKMMKEITDRHCRHICLSVRFVAYVKIRPGDEAMDACQPSTKTYIIYTSLFNQYFSHVKPILFNPQITSSPFWSQKFVNIQLF